MESIVEEMNLIREEKFSFESKYERVKEKLKDAKLENENLITNNSHLKSRVKKLLVANG